MSNASITVRILESVAAYESGLASAASVAESIELHEPALEAVPREVRDRLHSLSVQVLEQDVSPQEETLLGIKASRQALEELKLLLRSLICKRSINPVC